MNKQGDPADHQRSSTARGSVGVRRLRPTLRASDDTCDGINVPIIMYHTRMRSYYKKKNKCSAKRNFGKNQEIRVIYFTVPRDMLRLFRIFVSLVRRVMIL